MKIFTDGAVAMGCAVAGLYFLKFWIKTHDRLFALFGVAFWILALNRVALSALSHGSDAHIVCYIIRLVAFLIILFAIVDKNRASIPKLEPAQTVAKS